MTNLFQVTLAALTKLRKISLEEDKALQVRVAMIGGGCSGYSVTMNFTNDLPDYMTEQVQTIDGLRFLIDNKSALFVVGATLDYGGGLLDRGFRWDFPQATGGCGCGTSFSF